MNIYFACSITGGREFEPVYQAIVAALESAGHVIPTSHLASSEVMYLEKIISPQEVYARDIDWINKADALIAEVSTPSHGVGYEVAYALGIGKPVLCVYREGQRVSKMITGNSSSNLTVETYQTESDVLETIQAFLSNKPGHL